ncbi:MAG: SIMPL domain-containing protein [Crocinitomicaceae bacterium]|nr:SIMPL domain-containing protein [Crocinitomicaceae bacterium]
MELSKNFWGTLAVSIAVVWAAYNLGNAYKDKNRVNDTVEVTGLGTQDFTSDLIVWSGSFSRQEMDLQSANAQLIKDRKYIKKYLSDQGIPEEEMVFNAINISKQFEYIYDEEGNSHREFAGYLLSQTVKVESQEVDKVEKVAREVTDLINAGIEFNSYSPSYYYTGLEELKIEMIASATQNGRERAEKIAENSGATLGGLKSADMGLFHILGRNQNESYSWGGTFNTSSKYKTARVTMHLSFNID